MSRRFLHLLALVLMSLSLRDIATGQKIEPSTPPNHYIVLVDASGSISQSEIKRKLYDQALLGLTDKLYAEGFGPAIPPYKTDQDKLSLLHFGIVVGDTASAYSRLAEYDFSKDFIHQSITRQSSISKDQFAAAVIPSRLYQYTILSWAKELALEHLRAVSSAEFNQRTFLIMIHDGLPNENSIAGEVEMVRRWSGANYGRFSAVVSTIDRDYLFTDGSGNQKPALAEALNNPAEHEALPVFIEAYEVISAADAEWIRRGQQLTPLKGLQFRWLAESGEKPNGILSSQLTDEFAEWMRDGHRVELSMSESGNKQKSAGLQLPITFSERLTCSPPTIDAQLNVTIERSNPILGKRWLNYSKLLAIRAPPPWRCSAAFYGRASALILLTLTVICALIYYWHFRFRATHILIELPATVGAIQIMRLAGFHTTVTARPQLELEALTVRVPGLLWQRIFYRGAIISIASDRNQILQWSDGSSDGELRFPVLSKEPWVIWKSVPDTYSTITITFRHGSQHSEVKLAYPRGFKSDSFSRSINMATGAESNEQKVYVSLDLGSESMAAYYEDLSGNGGMIDLQTQAAGLLGVSALTATKEIGYLREELSNGDTRLSPRLWNRISLRDNSQPPNPGQAHATLTFNDSASYERSLFSYFHRVDGWPPNEKILPNPKILFQHQIKSILPVLRSDDGQSMVNISPAMLIQHLTVQVVRNFVLGSSKLKDVDASNIHLTITVPNVYSLPHALNLKDFVQRHAGVGKVEVLSESDAVACSVLSGPDDTDPPDLEQFKGLMEKSLTQRKRVSLLTIDVGKGTTDLSCILIEEPKRKRPIRQLFAKLRFAKQQSLQADDQAHLKYSVLGKTGRSSGGNYLSFLIAQHYDQRLQRETSRIRESTGLEVPFGFMTRSSDHNRDMPQLYAISDLEKLIERVKRAITEEYEIDEKTLTPETQRELLSPVVDKMLDLLRPNRNKAAEADDERAFRNAIIEALILPTKLGDVGWNAVWNWLTQALPGTHEQSQLFLRPVLERYVKENVDDLLDTLKGLVREHKIGKGNVIDRNVFVVVAGQASQFKPLQRAIFEKCGRLGMGRHKIHPMSGVRAKEACCQGVVNFKNLKMVVANPTELHGTYGCLAVGMRPKNQQFKPFDMRKIRNGGTSKIEFDAAVDHYVVFTPRAHKEVLTLAPKKNDGATALIARIEGRKEFTLEYNENNLELKVNGKTLELKGFGDIDGSIYPKVWPEIIAPSPD